MITTETERLQTLHDLYVLDTPEEQEFEELVRLTADRNDLLYADCPGIPY